MNTTTNYSLPQWEDTDRVTREDINGAMSAIDGAIKAADSGLRKFVIGTYTGNGVYGRNIYVGFTPRLLILGYNQASGNPFIAIGSNPGEGATLAEGGFRITSNNMNRSDSSYIYAAFG